MNKPLKLPHRAKRGSFHVIISHFFYLLQEPVKRQDPYAKTGEACGKAYRPSHNSDHPVLCSHPALPPSPMSSTTSTLALTGERRRSPSKWIFHLMNCLSHFSTSDVCATLSRPNVQMTAGPDGIPGCALRACAEQLAGAFTDIFNLSLPRQSSPQALRPPPSCQRQSTPQLRPS